MARLTHMTAPLLLLSAVVWGAEPESPDLLLRVSPRMSLAPLGGVTPILLTAEIVGPETEEYYCPEVVWMWSNGTRSSQQSDCDRFEARTDYPRRFTRRIGAPASSRDHLVCVELRKGGEPFDRTCARYTVR